MASEALHYLSLLDLSERLKSGAVTSLAATEAILDRIARYDPTLKSYAALCGDRALAKAREADTELRHGRWRGPLHGVPVAVKDLCFTDYAPTAAGMPVHRDFTPTYNATVVARLEAAGAIVLGKLHMTEGAYATYHPDMPIPVNPWNAEAWAGASSSGPGVATAAGLCYASLGSDTGGSIRFPSACNGLTGLKPTWGRVSRYGICHLSESLDHIGPMTRNAADCAAVLSVIAGADANDPTTLPGPAPDYLSGLNQGIRGLRLGIAEAYAFDGLDNAVSTAMTAAKDALIGLGARPVAVTFPPIDDAVSAWGVLAAVEAAIAHAPTFPSRAADYGPALAAFLESAGRITATDLAKAYLARDRFSGAVAAVFEDIDLLLIPVLTTPVPNPEEWASAANGDVAQLLRYKGEFNLTRQPALTLNGGFDQRGAPIGFQLIGKPLSEDMLLRAGHAYQGVTDWHMQHPPIA